MWSHSRMVCIRMKVVTWEIGTVATKANALFLSALVNITCSGQTLSSWRSFFSPTTSADRLLIREIHVLCNRCS